MYNFRTNYKNTNFSVKKISDQIFLGGAAIVAKHLSKLGAKVTFTTLIGEDKIGSFVKKDLKKSKIKVNYIDKSRNTTVKERFGLINISFFKLTQ